MRVLGVDPGLTRCGLGWSRAERDAPGCWRSASRTPDRCPRERLVYLESQLDTWLDRFTPRCRRVERVFADVNVASVMTTAHATAIALLAAARATSPSRSTRRPRSKRPSPAVAGRHKAQVTTMVMRIPARRTPRPADAADALALAICHVWRGEAQAADAAVRASPSGGWRDDRQTGARSSTWAWTGRWSRSGSGSVRPHDTGHRRVPWGGATPSWRRARRARGQPDLYGFAGAATSATCSRRCRRSAVSAPGSPLAMLSVLPPADLRRAVAGTTSRR